ncbi:MAG: hypothetical protein GX442_22260 [Candidatus Riflebacteria bacterium]|nr:hypothetical protein [Candidatus Riflebacteria bacterium]
MPDVVSPPPPLPRPAVPRPAVPSATPGKTASGAPGQANPAADGSQEEQPSRLFRALTSILYLGLIGAFSLTLVTLLFALDFLDILQFRYRLPLGWRTKWPLSSYYDFVAMHQLPDEERFAEQMRRRKQEFDDLMVRSNADITRRNRELEEAYQNLARVQDESYQKRQRELDAVQEELLRQKKLIEDMKQDLEARKAGVDILARQVASEAASLESSLIRFMEEENRLRPVQDIAATMEPQAIGAILDEVPDNVLIYNILRGIPADRSALILSFMDPEKAGKILKISKNPPTLPDPGPSRSYVPPGLQDLVASTNANLR